MTSKNSLAFRALLLLPAIALALVSPLARGEEGWISLFDGKTLKGWTADKTDTIENWEVQDGCIHWTGKGANLNSTQDFLNFELEFEWKVAPGTNSGLKYRYSGGIGPEYQILDDEGGHAGGKEKGVTASLYEIKAPTGKVLKPVGEFNQSRVVARGNHLEHWLNGVKVVEIDIDTPEWAEAKAGSKFKDKEGFATKPGPIHLQDHGGEVWFRNLRIKPLD